MNIFDEILETLKNIEAALAGGAPTAKEAPKTGTAGKAPPPKKPAPKAKGPSLEDVQDLIRELVAADSDNKVEIKKAIKSIDKTAERAGDFEDDAVKLGKLHAKLTALNGGDAEEEAAADDDDDML